MFPYYAAASGFLQAAATDPLRAFVVLHLRGNGTPGATTTTDISPTPKTVTLSNGAVIDAIGAFDQSIRYPGGLARATVGGPSDFNLPGDFCFEKFCRFHSLPSGPETYVQHFAGNTGTTQLFLTSRSNGQGLRAGRTGVIAYAEGDFTFATGQFYWIVAQRRSNAWRLWVDGNDITTGTPSASFTFSGGLQFASGAVGTTALNGYDDEVRLTSAARYENGTGANAGKAVLIGTNTLAYPTAPFPAS